MGAFGLGTLPALLATGAAARQMGTLIRHPATRTLAALLIIIFALWQLGSLWPQLVPGDEPPPAHSHQHGG